MVKTLHSLQGAQVQSQVRELRSHKPHSKAKKKVLSLVMGNKYLLDTVELERRKEHYMCEKLT